MKKVTFMFFLIVAASCSDGLDDQLTVGNLKLEAADSKAILKGLEASLSAGNPDSVITFSTSELKKIDGAYYLVAKNDEYVSTTLLKKGEGNTLVSAGISCTSKNCGNGDGCIPQADGQSCTPCGTTEDCTKTVTQE
ncbi:hypothetical protein [Pontibacter arcticus]|uniref:Uncharacterized protein n=1 Tax=Pontibacter arcticus TaxID=2080288 RepID=A0A364RHZ9_9BACT|nr:hypothetical protein [Pontibacter arcticus]RAU83912.1 hypothetical protein DP923_02270 [Pontibacter arcticus]